MDRVMGWQGQIHKRSELERVAAHFGIHWQQIIVRAWRDDQFYWVTLPDGRKVRVRRDTLEEAPLKEPTGWCPALLSDTGCQCQKVKGHDGSHETVMGSYVDELGIEMDELVEWEDKPEVSHAR
jgi:hypothetical protein